MGPKRVKHRVATSLRSLSNRKRTTEMENRAGYLDYGKCLR